MTHSLVQSASAEESAEYQLGSITANLDVFHSGELCQILRSLGEEVADPDAPESDLRRLIEAAAWDRYSNELEFLDKTNALIDDLLASRG